jgi:Asp-tRNA(Asn)/Glu-tRNA(Gln) amidotransferase B subunit
MKDLANNTNPSPEEVKGWEEKNGKLTKVKVAGKDGEGEPQYFYFKRPNLSVLRLAQKDLLKNRDTLGYATIIIKNTVVNGLAVIENDEEILMALLPIADELTTSKVAEIEKN